MGTSVKVDLPQTQTRHRTADETTTAMFRLASATLGLEQRKADKVLPMFGTRTLNHVINSHKALCFPVIGSMVLAAEQQHSVRAACTSRCTARTGCAGASSTATSPIGVSRLSFTQRYGSSPSSRQPPTGYHLGSW